MYELLMSLCVLTADGKGSCEPQYAAQFSTLLECQQAEQKARGVLVDGGGNHYTFECNQLWRRASTESIVES